MKTRASSAALAAVTAFTMTSPARAEDAAGEIVVLGSGPHETPGIPAYDSVMIGADRLAGEASGRLENILADVAGFQQFRRADSRAANPTSQGVTLRALGGNASSRALVLLDGVPIADPFTGFVPFTAIDPARLSAIRVTRGGGAGPFGSGALAGTIELSSAGPDALPTIAGQALAGSRSSIDAGGGIVVPLGSGFVAASGGWQRGDGYVLVPRRQRGPIDVPSRYDAWRIGGRVVAKTGGGGELQGSISGFDDDRLRGLPGAEIGLKGVDASMRFIDRGRWGIDALAYIQARDFTSRTVVADVQRTTASLSLDQYATPSTGLGGRFELRPPIEGHVLRIGIDARRASGSARERSRYVNGLATRSRMAGGRTLVAGGYAEDDWSLGRLTLTGGARIDRWTISNGRLDERDIATGAPTQQLVFPDRSGWRTTARAGALYHASDALSLRAAAYTGFRVPTLNELYRPFRVGADATAANANLALERLRGIEAGITVRPIEAARLSLTVFDNRLEGAIANVTVAQGPGTFPQVGFVTGAFRERRNIDAIVARGVEASGLLTLGKWSLIASYAYSAARVHASGAAVALDGKRPAQSPAHGASATLGWTPTPATLLSATLRYASHQYEDDLQQRRLPAALIVDAYARVPLLAGVRLVARAENLFDEDEVSGLSGTGIVDLGTPRTLWVGLAVAID